MNLPRMIAGIVGSLLILGGLMVGYVWSAFRVYVPPNMSLVVINKTGEQPPEGQIIAGPNQKGIQRDTLGPGRYFLNPWTQEWELHELVSISAGDPQGWREIYEEGKADYEVPTIAGSWPELGVLVNRLGKDAGGGDEVVSAGFKGIQREVLTPGVYRINPHEFEVKKFPATVVPLGCTGVVISQSGEMPGSESVQETVIGPDGQITKGPPKVIQKLAEKGQRGVQRNVLPPGIYYANPYVHKIQVVQIGYNQISQLKGADAATNISFPSKDGFNIEVEVTVVWGRHPEHTPEMVNRFGDVEKLKEIILGQTRSICRNLGSEYDSTDFIRGEKREMYQREVTELLQRVCAERDIDILIALIHNIEVHGGEQPIKEGTDLKRTIQRGFIAREQEITKQAQRETASVNAELQTARSLVEISREQILAETRKKVAEVLAEGAKQAQEIDAQRDLEVSRIDRQIAELDGEKTRILGKANATVEELKNSAEARGQRMMIEAFGTGRAYNLYMFAENFAPDSIRLIFAGEGTFWTDLSRLQDAATMQILKESGASRPPPSEKSVP